MESDATDLQQFQKDTTLKFFNEIMKYRISFAAISLNTSTSFLDTNH